MTESGNTGEAVWYRFGRCSLDLRRRELRVAGAIVALQPRTFAVLAYLVTNAPRVCTKDQLLAEIWPTNCVTDGVLSTAITKVRRAIEDNGRVGRMLRTLHGVGYRFDAEVVRSCTDSGAGRVEAKPSAVMAAATPLALSKLTFHADGEDQDPINADLSSFEPAQITRARYLAGQGQLAPALWILERCNAPLQFDDAMLLVRLRRQRVQFSSARAALDELSATFIDHDAGIARNRVVEILLESARLYDSESEILAALQVCDRALEVIGSSASDHQRQLAEVLGVRARCQYLLGNFSQIPGSSKKIIELAESFEPQGDKSPSVVGYLAHSRVLARLGELPAAHDYALKALILAKNSSTYDDEADACTELAYLNAVGFDFPQSISYAQRAHHIITDFGDLTRRDRARARHVMGCVSLSRLDEAETLLNEFEAEPSVAASGMARYNFSVVRAQLEWRLGNADGAIRKLEQLIDDWWLYWPGLCRDLLVERVERHLALGNTAPAIELLSKTDSALDVHSQAKLRASIALLGGDRRAAKQELRNAWMVHNCSTIGAWHVPLSLALMQIEDCDSSGLDELMAAVRALPQSHPMVALLLKIYLFFLHEEAVNLDEWEPLVRKNVGLIHRHRWLLDTEALQDWISGHRQLPVLLYLACF